MPEIPQNPENVEKAAKPKARKPATKSDTTATTKPVATSSDASEMSATSESSVDATPKVRKTPVKKASPAPSSETASPSDYTPPAPVVTPPAAPTLSAPAPGGRNYYFPPATPTSGKAPIYSPVSAPTSAPASAAGSVVDAAPSFAGSVPPANTLPPIGSVPPAGTIPPAFGGPAKASNPKRALTLPVVVAIALAAAVVGGGSGAGIAAYFVSQNGSTPSGVVSQGVTINDSANVSTVTAVAEKASPSVVTISVVGSNSAGSGSGIVLSEDGYVLTNNHVATLDGATDDAIIQVRDNAGNLFTASIVGVDPTVDLAVLKLDNATDMIPMEWADSSELNVGDAAIALGAPLGLAGTVTTGIVSALNRSIQIASSAVPETTTPEEGTTPDNGTAPDGSSPFDFWNFDFGQGNGPDNGEDGSSPQTQVPSASSSISIPVIQTDAAINPGNSGGALLDAQGRLIGINVAIASAGGSSGQAGSIGVGFALPSNLAKRVSEEIIATGTATHGLLGAQVSDAASAEGSRIVGALIQESSAGGAAEKADIRAGDVITRFNGVPITDAIDITAQVRTLAAGSKAEIEINRDGRTLKKQVTLGSL